ncbi:recombinase family protein [Cypionkella sp. TWP1-2-1b2]|uniref:recombinase family protein n=1 Tax=Cypionkella sp. TWP1-2-1b2 TaxID=2804675 RepID=UPI003CF7F50F
MGGTLPPRYDPPKDPLGACVLEINPAEAVTMRHRFALYLTAGSLGATQIAAAEQGFSPRKSDHVSGHAAGLAPATTIAQFSNGQLHYLLTNPAYRGLIRHKILVHPGQHEPIVGEALWSAVQSKLQDTAARKRQRAIAPTVTTDADSPLITPQNSVEPSAPLIAKLFDETGGCISSSRSTAPPSSLSWNCTRRPGKWPPQPSCAT